MSSTVGVMLTVDTGVATTVALPAGRREAGSFTISGTWSSS